MFVSAPTPASPPKKTRRHIIKAIKQSQQSPQLKRVFSVLGLPPPPQNNKTEETNYKNYSVDISLISPPQTKCGGQNHQPHPRNPNAIRASSSPSPRPETFQPLPRANCLLTPDNPPQRRAHGHQVRQLRHVGRPRRRVILLVPQGDHASVEAKNKSGEADNRDG